MDIQAYTPWTTEIFRLMSLAVQSSLIYAEGSYPVRQQIIMHYSWWLVNNSNIPTASNRNLEIIQFTLLLHASAFIDDSVSKILVTSKWPSFTAEWRALLPRMNIYLWWKSTITYDLANFFSHVFSIYLHFSIYLPRLSATEKSTPFDSRILQTSAKPFSAATCKAVCPPSKKYELIISWVLKGKSQKYQWTNK